MESCCLFDDLIFQEWCPDSHCTTNFYLLKVARRKLLVFLSIYQIQLNEPTALQSALFMIRNYYLTRMSRCLILCYFCSLEAKRDFNVFFTLVSHRENSSIEQKIVRLFFNC